MSEDNVRQFPKYPPPPVTAEIMVERYKLAIADTVKIMRQQLAGDGHAEEIVESATKGYLDRIGFILNGGIPKVENVVYKEESENHSLEIIKED